VRNTSCTSCVYTHARLDRPTRSRYLSVMIPATPTSWTDRLAFDIAMRLENSGEPLDEILRRHNLQPQAILDLNTDQTFLRRVATYRDEIREKGVTFRLKARAQAEELLRTSWLLIHNPDVSPAVKADLIKSTVRWAGLEPPPPARENGDGVSGGVKITINLGGSEVSTTLRDASDIDGAST